jgi:hypothetical protein
MNDPEGPGTKLKPPEEAGLLGSAISAIDLMMHNNHGGKLGDQTLGDFSGAVRAFVIHNDGDSIIPEPDGETFEYRGKGFFRAVRRNDDGFFHG